MRTVVTAVLALSGVAATATTTSASPIHPVAAAAGGVALPWPGKLGLGLAGATVVLVVGLVRRSTWVALFDRLGGRRRSDEPGADRTASPLPLPVATAPPKATAPAQAAAPAAGRDLAPAQRGREAAVPESWSTTPRAGAPAPTLRAHIVEVSNRDPAMILLVGSRTAQAAPAWLWLDPSGEAPGSTYVALGHNEQGTLWVDLIRAPDVVTLTGDPSIGQRMGAALADQLVRRKVPVTVIGSALGPRRAGVHTLRSLGEAVIATDDPSSPQVIFSSYDRADRATIRRLADRSAPRTVVVLLGDGRPGRWSIEVHGR
jgi:hypothetical protein